VIYVPPTLAATPIPCTGAPAGWVIYIVQPGDTLYHIASLYRITVDQLMTANCLTGTVIYTGQSMYVPNVPTSTPSGVSATATPSATSGGPTSTNTTAPTDTATPTASDTPLPTDTPSPTSTDTPTPTPTL
jgi:LysM repeat protein